jgi:hypothetical protein
MIRRYLPEQPDGTRVNFDLPKGYILGTEITLFVNGQLLDVENDKENPYGYFLSDTKKIFTFYEAPLDDDHLYIMYDDGNVDLNFDNVDWSKSIRVIDFSVKINPMKWEEKINPMKWEENINSLSFKVNTNVIEFGTKIIKNTFKYSIK